VSPRGALACVRACVRALRLGSGGRPYGHAVDALVLIFQDALGRPTGCERGRGRRSSRIVRVRGGAVPYGLMRCLIATCAPVRAS
jgi:hypothetical protein